jgi:hypothetical protein
MNQYTDLIIKFNFILLIGLVIGIIRWQKKHGKITDKKITLILLGYFSYSFITPSLLLLPNNPGLTIVMDLGFLLILWGIGYPLLRWMLRQFNENKLK